MWRRGEVLKRFAEASVYGIAIWVGIPHPAAMNRSVVGVTAPNLRLESCFDLLEHDFFTELAGDIQISDLTSNILRHFDPPSNERTKK
jgi:hypothetical protein